MGGTISSPSSSEISPPIQTKTGSVRGKVYTFDDNKYDAFLGIPFAEPPVGENRFKKPKSVSPWNGIKDCFQFGPRCPQKNDFIDKRMNIVGIDEAGCLTLNIVSPRSKCEHMEHGYPVMVWIHGGGFCIHSSSNYGDATVARNLCSKGVVYCSINYRLGVYGFFASGDEKCKGNLGLWDQTLALQWIKDNISAFGGDPSNITIFGQSAGGASVDLLCLSPHSRDLFKRAIAMSGTAECFAFAMRSNESQASISKRYARSLGWKGEDSDTEGLMKFMTAHSASLMFPHLTPHKKPFKVEEPCCFPFLPNFDGDFFPLPISELRKQMPKKDMIVGCTEAEGLILSAATKIPFTLKGMNQAMDLLLKESEFGSDYPKIREEILDFYTKDVDPKDKKHMMIKHTEFLGDCVINIGAVQCAQSMAKLGHNVFFYNFEYHNPEGFGLLKWFMPFIACSHGSELRYILGKGVITKFKPNEDDLKMLEIVTTYFTNFAKYGNPNGEGTVYLPNTAWEKYTIDKPYRHCNIQLPNAIMTDDFQGRRNEFWEKHILPKNKAWAEVHKQP